MKTETWYSYKIQKVFQELNSSKKGLSGFEVKKRLERFGENKLPEEKKLSGSQIFLNQFKNPLIYILVVAAAISFVMKEFIDMGVILSTVAVNTIIGFFQENKANKAISLLKKMVEYGVIVLRDNRKTQIDSKQLVPGDIIFLVEGEKIPADARIIEENNLQVIEASLTGESIPSDKNSYVLPEGTVVADRENMVYMGTTVARGKGMAIVCETGIKTEIGKVTQLIKETKEEETPLQIKLKRLSRILAIFIAAITVLIFVLGIWRIRTGVEHATYFQMFETAVAIAVAAIPEGLIVAVTVILAIGMQRILKKKALTRKLIAAETLGSTSVICTDKTGTLTENKMQVSHISAYDEILVNKKIEFKGGKGMGDSHIEALKIGMLCNNSVIENPEEELKKWKVLGDPTETALLLAAVNAGLEKKKLDKDRPRLDEIPFDSDKKYMVTLNKYNEKQNAIYVKGAPETVLNFSTYIKTEKGKRELTIKEKETIKKQINEFTKKGLRVLGVAYKLIDLKTEKLLEDQSKDFVYVGIIGLHDPVRKEAPETIEICRQAGIRPIIVTGDHKLTAKAIAKEVGINVKEKNIIEGWELDKMDDRKLKKIIREIEIYARVSPKHKVRIIDAWQAVGEVVAMTGDGVNDAPAIKAADIGVALGSGTDVAKETSDLILLDNNFKTIVDAVNQGRVIFDNIRKVVTYLLSSGFTEIILIGGSLLMGLPLPLLPTQILWINVIQDGLPNFALAFEPGEEEVMKDKPRKLKESILNTEMKVLIFIIGIFTDLVLFGLFIYFWKIGYNFEHLRTIVFAGLGIASMFYIWSCKTLRKNIWQINFFTNKYLIFSVIAGVFLLFGAIYIPFLQTVLRTVPLTMTEFLIVIGLGVINLISVEATKWFFIVRKYTS